MNSQFFTSQGTTKTEDRRQKTEGRRNDFVATTTKNNRRQHHDRHRRPLRRHRCTRAMRRQPQPSFPWERHFLLATGCRSLHPHQQRTKCQHGKKRRRQVDARRLTQVLHQTERSKTAPPPSGRSAASTTAHAIAYTATAPNTPKLQCNNFAATPDDIFNASKYSISVSCGRFE